MHREAERRQVDNVTHADGTAVVRVRVRVRGRGGGRVRVGGRGRVSPR